MSATRATRTLEGVELPAPGSWVVDPSHSGVDVVARHIMISKVRGRFASFSGRMVVAERPEDSTVEVTIDSGGVLVGRTLKVELSLQAVPEPAEQ